MSSDPKTLVERAYDSIADSYLNWVQYQPSHRETYTKKLLSNVPSSPHILELGCGAGEPITRLLLDHGAKVIANDISTRQISLAKTRCPGATFISRDMTLLFFPPATFDAVVSFFAIFHLPRGEQKNMLVKIHSWLKPGGMFVLNLATKDQDEIRGEMLGHGMFWSSYGIEENEKMVGDVGFEVVEAEVREAGEEGLKEGDLDYGVSFLWVVAKKREWVRVV